MNTRTINEIKKKKNNINFLKLLKKNTDKNNKFEIKKSKIAALSPEKIRPKKHTIKKIRQILL